MFYIFEEGEHLLIRDLNEAQVLRLGQQERHPVGEGQPTLHDAELLRRNLLSERNDKRNASESNKGMTIAPSNTRQVGETTS